MNKDELLDNLLLDPIKRFINNSTTGGIVLFSAAIVAIGLANSPLSEWYFKLWHVKFSIGFDNFMVSKDLSHWINDGLMAIFFFVVGLELKREIIAGELNNFRKSLLPIAAAVGGMVVPALVYLLFNPSGEAQNGWGIPMATDIAFALGVLYLLGDRVPVSAKIFLTALAIVDDIGAVLVIAFFYTSNINYESLFIGGIFLAVLVSANYLGVRNVLFYGLVGIGGLWLAFLMSGVHATIAAVIAAFTIPANVVVDELGYYQKAKALLKKYRDMAPNNKPTVTDDQLHVLSEIRLLSKSAQTPLQRLEHSLHPWVAFIVMPVFALANAGVVISDGIVQQASSPIALGVFLGLMAGKVIGITLAVRLLVRFKLAELPAGLNNMHLLGLAFLGAIGFTMSLFVAELAFDDPAAISQAKIGILLSSVVASIIGYFIIKNAGRQKRG
ncbi:MAG: Na+/H+ antiporter NhaA [Saprospiraceae bacterium]|jgi:NhaA family Na+:H+ antiporter|nr:Na+/H+ antiporter NhaA [Saprospiraceae bacterium]